MVAFRRTCGGVTLVEALVTLALLALIPTVGAPALSAFVDSVRLRTGLNTFLATVLFARSEAAKRKTRVVLCKSSGTGACSTEGGWEQGWIVFEDTNNNAALDPGEALLLSEPALPGRVRLTGNSQLTSYLSYTPNGSANLVSGAFQAGTLTICVASDTPMPARQIVISATGRPRTAKVTLDRCL